MKLEALLVTNDSKLLSVMNTTLAACGVVVHVRADSQSALEIGARRRFDGLLIDCDDVPGGVELVSKLRQTRSTSAAMIIAITNGRTPSPVALGNGANFVVSKPVTAEHASQILQLAIVPMTRERQRYFRYDVCLPVTARASGGHEIHTKLLNISESGLAMQSVATHAPGVLVELEFRLPDINQSAVIGKAEIVWKDGDGRAGLRFVTISPRSFENLSAWLRQLQAQLEFNTK